MENDPDAALVDSFFLPGGILDPESYEQEEEKPKQKKTSAVESNNTNADTAATPPVTYQRFTPAVINPDNPWATSEIIPPPHEPLAVSSPTMFTTMHTANNSNPEVEALRLYPPPNVQPIMAPPPGFESSVPLLSQQVQTSFPPMIRMTETFEEDESIACSVPRELIPSHQEKDSIYGDGSSTSSLSHSTCGAPTLLSTPVQVEDEGLMLDLADEQPLTSPTSAVERCHQGKDTRKRKQKEEDEANDIRRENRLSVGEKELLNKDGNKDEKYVHNTKANGTAQRGQPTQLEEEEMKPKTTTKMKNTGEQGNIPELQPLADPVLKTKRRRGHKRASSSLNKSKSPQHELQESPPILNQKHAEERDKKSARDKKVMSNRPTVRQQKLKDAPDEATPLKKARSFFVWDRTRWVKPFPLTLTQQQQQAIRIVLIIISFTSMVFHAAIKEICTKPSSLYVYAFFWTYPYLSSEVLIDGLSLPHWVPHVTTLMAIWDICTPTTTFMDKNWFWRLLRFITRRGNKNKKENSIIPKINLRHCPKQRLVVILYTVRLIAVCNFIYDGFSQPHASIILHLSPSSRTLVAYILLVIKSGWYQSPLLLLWSTMTQCVVKCIFYSSNHAAVVLNMIIGLASLHYKERLQEEIDYKRLD